MNKSSNKRYAIVTGAGSGLGREFCLRLARDGWQLALVDVDSQAVEQVQELVSICGVECCIEVMDVADADAWQRLRDKLREQWPRLDLLINNAGVCAAGEIDECNLDELRHVLDVNLRGVLYGCHTMVPWLKEHRQGHIVNVASIFGLAPAPAMVAYNASKAAVVALSETLYAELSGWGVGVTVVASGFFESRLLEHGSFASPVLLDAAMERMQASRFTAERVVEATLRAVRRRRLYVVLGRRARWLWRWKRWAPMSLLHVFGRGYRRLQSGDGTGD